MKLRTVFGIILGIVGAARPWPPRARMVIVNDCHQVLLVKNRFGLDEWELPGGGVQRKEDPKDAAVREVREELGLVVKPASVCSLGTYTTRHTYAPMQLCVFGVTVHRGVTIRRSFEIKEAKWFSLSGLPQDEYDNFSQAIKEWLRGIS